MQTGDNAQEPRPRRKKQKEEETPEQDTAAQPHGEHRLVHEHMTKFTPKGSEDRDDGEQPKKIGP